MAKRRKKFMKIYFILEILIFTVNWNQVEYFIHHEGSFSIQLQWVLEWIDGWSINHRYLELRALAAELGIYFTQSVDKKHVDYLLYEEAQSKKEVLDADMQEQLEASKIPKIVTEKWKIRMTKKYNAPVGFARNPGEIPESRGNEEWDSSMYAVIRLLRVSGTGL